MNAGTDRTLSHNLNGQKLGRKGRDTRDRILAAAAELLDGPRDTQITLSAVARKASLGMTSLYLYFNDMTELLLAVLDPVMATAEQDYVAHLREHWPEESLKQHCLEFVVAYHAFWEKHSRILHLRNSMADQQDKRMMLHRLASGQPMIRLLVEQMEGNTAEAGSPCYGMASVLTTGIERVVTIATDTYLPKMLDGQFTPNVQHYLQAGARLLELAILEYRAIGRETASRV